MEETMQYCKTDNGNCYLYSSEKGYLTPINPVFYELLQNQSMDVNGKQEIKRNESIFKEITDYYFEKHNFLKRHGFMKDENVSVTRRLTKDDLETTLSNLKQVTIEVTERCNLNCVYCVYNEFYEKTAKRESNNLAFNQLKGLFNFLIPFWNSSLNGNKRGITNISFYGGEPLLKFDFIKKAVEFIKGLEVNRIFVFSMTTNGVLLDKYMDYLVTSDFHLLVSLDGNQKNNSYRIFHNGKESFSRIIDNLVLLKQKYPVFFDKNVNFNSVLHNRNNITDIYNFIRKKFDKTPRIAPLSISEIRAEKVIEFNKIYRDFYTEIKTTSVSNFAQIKKELYANLPGFSDLGNFLKQSNIFYFDNIKELFSNKSGIQTYPTGTCLPFSKKLFLTANGLILPCERIAHKFSLGKISVKSIVDLDFEKIVKKYNDYYSNLQNQCSRCYLAPMCKQCMFLIDKIEDAPKCKGFIHRKYSKKYFQNLITLAENNPIETHKLMFETIYEK